MFKKKNILIGIIGIATTVLAVAVLFYYGVLTQNMELYVVLPAIVSVLFFFGYLFGGFITALSLGGTMAAAFLIMIAPDLWKGPLVFAWLLSAFAFPRIKAALLNGKARALMDVSDNMAEYEAERELEAAEQSLFANAVYLIKPNKFKGDVTYKVVNRDGNILFFNVGGQFYTIDSELAMDDELDIWDIEWIKGSFVLDKNDIRNIIINTKRRKWTGYIQNSGSVSIVTADKTIDYILHGINDYPAAQAFFEEALGYPPEMIFDQKREQEEQLDREFEEEYEPEKALIKKISKVLNIIGYPICLWLIFYPRPIHLAVAIGILLPIVGMAFYIKNSRFVTLDEHQNQKAPSVTSAVIMPPLGLALLTLIGFNIIYSWQMWLVFALISLVISILIIIRSRELRLRKILASFVAVIIFVYIYGAATVSNCLYDYHTPKLKSSRVVDKDFSVSSRHETYYVVLESWRQDGEIVKATVTKSQYASSGIGDSLIVATFDGLFGIEWYRIYGKAESSGNNFGKSGLLGTLNG